MPVSPLAARLTAAHIMLGAGAMALALMLGALGFQYVGGLVACHMCHWQRWPLIAAIVLALAGQCVPAVLARPMAALVLLLIAVSGLIGAYQAGMEWHFWPGPATCTVGAFTGNLADINAPMTRCDVAAFRLFGLSLAGYNALISLLIATMGAVLLRRRHMTSAA